MNIAAYNINDDKRTINKTIGAPVKTYNNVHLKENTDIINPVFVLDGIGVSSGIVINANYLFCSYFNRYYFIENIKYCLGGIVEIECHVDVLESFKTDILNSTAYVTRQENATEKKNYFYDNSYPIRSDVTAYPIKIGTVGSGYGYYLTVNGGVQ